MIQFEAIKNEQQKYMNPFHTYRYIYLGYVAPLSHL